MRAARRQPAPDRGKTGGQHPQTQQPVYLVSLEAFPPQDDKKPSSWYLTRTADAQYSLHEIPALDNPRIEHPMLEGTRTLVVSPFPEDDGQVIYVGGYDASFAAGHNTAWIYKASLATVLGEDM